MNAPVFSRKGQGSNSAAHVRELKKASLWLCGAFALAVGVATIAARTLHVPLLSAMAWFLAWAGLVAFIHLLYLLLQSSDLAREESESHPPAGEKGRRPLLPPFARWGQSILLGLGGVGLLTLLYTDWREFTALPADAVAGMRLTAVLFLVTGFALHFFQRYAGSVQAQNESTGLNGPVHLARLSFGMCLVIAATFLGFLYLGRDYGLQVGRGVVVVTAVLVIEAWIRAGLAAFQPRTLLPDLPPLGGSLILEVLLRRRNPLDALVHHVESSFGVKVGHGWVVQFLRQTIEPMILAGLVLPWISTCFTAVPTQSHGVRVRWGRYLAPALAPGLYVTWPWPAEKIAIIPTERIDEIHLGYAHDLGGPELWAQVHYEGEQNLLVGNGEELLSISVPIYYRIKDPLAYLETTTDSRQALTSLAYRQLLAVTEARDSFRMMTVDRQAISRALQESLQREVDRLHLGLEIVYVGLQGIHPPVAVAPAYQDVVSAEEEEQVYIHQADAYRLQTLAEAAQEANRLRTGADAMCKQRIALAEGESSRFVLLADADAANATLLRLRLRLEAMEESLANPSKLVLGRAATLNGQFYLDLRNSGALPRP